MKKIFIILMSLCFLFSLVGCSNQELQEPQKEIIGEYEIVDIYQYNKIGKTGSGINYHVSYLTSENTISSIDFSSVNSDIVIADSSVLIKFKFNGWIRYCLQLSEEDFANMRFEKGE